MRSFILGLLFGAIVSAVVGGLGYEFLREAPSPARTPGTTATVAPLESAAHPQASDGAEAARKLDGATDATLAETLDAAEFDRDWGRVNGVGRVLRSRTPLKVDPITGLADSGGPRTRAQPLVALEAEIARRGVVLDLRSHDNAATKLLDHAGEDEAATKLADLFLAEARGPDYEPLRIDAAIVLALGGSDKSRDVLGRALKEGGERGLLAARALGLSDDERGLALLAEFATKDVEPEVRKRAIGGLARSSSVARGLPDPVAALVHAARDDADEGVRTVAIQALGAADLARADGARALVIQILREPSEPLAVRLASVEAIRAHRTKAHATPPELVDALLRSVGSEHDGPVRVAVAEALVEIAPASAVSALETALGSAQDAAVRDPLTRAVAAAKQRGEPPP